MGSTGGGTSTSTSTPTLDPQVRAALLGNVDLANTITSGILPNLGQAGGAPMAPGAPVVPGMTGFGGGAQGQSPYAPGAGDDWMNTSVPYASGTPTATNADGTPYQAPTTLSAGFTADQNAAFQKIRDVAGNPLQGVHTGADVQQGLTQFQAPDMTAAQIDPTKNFTDYDFSAYANPYMSNVVDPLKAYFAEQGDRAGAASQAQARASGALRGSNRDVGNALARGEIATAGGNALSPIYADAFKTSAGLIQNDAAAANARAANQATLQQQAGLANQNASVASANVRGTAATNYGAANQAARNSELTGISLLGAAGDQQQQQDQKKYDDLLKALQIRMAATGQAVPGTTGTTTTGTTPGGGIGGVLGGLGGLASGIGALAAL